MTNTKKKTARKPRGEDHAEQNGTEVKLEQNQHKLTMTMAGFQIILPLSSNKFAKSSELVAFF